MLDDLNLTHTMRDEVLMITSREAAEENCDIRVYKVSSIRTAKNLDELIEVIVQTVAPNSWDEVGGPGRITAFDGGLIVRQAQQVHHELNEFLEQLERLHEAD